MDDLIAGLTWQRDNAVGAALDADEVLAVLAMADEIERLRRGLEAVTAFDQAVECHAAARASLAGMDAIKAQAPRLDPTS